MAGTESSGSLAPGRDAETDGQPQRQESAFHAALGSACMMPKVFPSVSLQ